MHHLEDKHLELDNTQSEALFWSCFGSASVVVVVVAIATVYFNRRCVGVVALVGLVIFGLLFSGRLSTSEQG